MPRHLLALALAATVLAGCGRPAAAPGAATTLIFVRHAEKAEATEDAPLSTAGKKRAQALVLALAAAGIEAIYAPPARHAQETARPLARRLDLPVSVSRIDPERLEEEARSFALRLVARHPGQTVLVVGHAEAIPPMVEALTARPIEPLETEAYDPLFVVTLPPEGRARLLRARYGPPDPATEKKGQTTRPRPSRKPSRG